MTVVDLASDTYKYDLNEPSDLSVAFIAQWYRAHVGDLNNFLNNGYIINDSQEIVDGDGATIDTDAAAIFKKLFEIGYNKRQSRAFLGAAGVDSITVIQQDGIVTRGVDRNQIAKSYNQLYKEAKAEFTKLLNNYRFKGSAPKHVESDDKYSIYDIDTTTS